jgi:hypothetical protein
MKLMLVAPPRIGQKHREETSTFDADGRLLDLIKT